MENNQSLATRFLYELANRTILAKSEIFEFQNLRAALLLNAFLNIFFPKKILETWQI